MTFIELFLFAVSCIAIISNWINAKNIDRLEKRVHEVEISCEEVAKKYNSLKRSLKRVKGKLNL
ncbi:hypothetical protein NHG32_06970 [Aerococcaceae bacterium NML191219]|nr:hypothetical protein [Aerococcaceae bacterium NML191219]